MGYLERIKHSISQIPVIIPLTGLVTGIILSWYFNNILLTTLLFGLSAILTLALKRKIFTIVFLTGLIGSWSTSLSLSPSLDSRLFGKSIEFHGHITDTYKTDGIQRFQVSVHSLTADSINISGFKPFNIYLYSYSDNNISEYDDIQFTTVLKPIDNNRVLTQISFEKNNISNKIKGIKAYGSLEKGKYEINGKHECPSYFFFKIKSKISLLLSKGNLTENCERFINAILTGETSDFDDTTRETFSKIGLSHVLALSGTHLGIVHGFIILLLFPLSLIGKKNISRIISLVLIWVYAFMTGLSPSVTRAGIMISLVIISQLAERRRNEMNSLFFATLLILLFSPLSLFSISFQLSFCAVFAIILLDSSIRKYKANKNKRDFFLDLLTVSIFAMAGTGLLSVYYFHIFPVYFLLANIPAAFILPIQIIGGIVHIIFSACDLSTYLLDISINRTYEFMIIFSDSLASLPGAVIEDIYINPLAFIPYFFTLISLKLFLERQTFNRGLLMSSLLLLTICTASTDSIRRSDNGIYFSNDSRFTDIIIKTDRDIFCVTTKLDETPSLTKKRVNKRYKDFKVYNKTKIIETLETDSTGYITDNKLINIRGNMNLLIVNNNPKKFNFTTDDKINYLVIGRGLGNNELDYILERINVDTVILPREINYLNEKKYIKSIQNRNIPYVTLRDTDYIIPLSAF